MARMTEEEATALAEKFAKDPPKVDPSKKGGIFTRQRDMLDALDRVTADYIMAVINEVKEVLKSRPDWI